MEPGTLCVLMDGILLGMRLRLYVILWVMTVSTGCVMRRCINTLL